MLKNKTNETYREFMARKYKELTETEQVNEFEKILIDTNPLILRIESLEKRLKELERKVD